MNVNILNWLRSYNLLYSVFCATDCIFCATNYIFFAKITHSLLKYLIFSMRKMFYLQEFIVFNRISKRAMQSEHVSTAAALLSSASCLCFHDNYVRN